MSENYKTIEYITLPPEKTEEGQPEQLAKTYEIADKTWRESPLFNIKTGDIIRWNRKGSGGGSNILDQDGKIEQEYFPSWVNDVLQFNGQEAFPQVGESDKIYIDQISNLLYRWNGNEYIAISSPPEEEEEEIEYTATFPIGIDTDTNEIYHQDSGVTTGIYKGYFASKGEGFYTPSFDINEQGHVIYASNLGTLIPDNSASAATNGGLLKGFNWATGIRSYISSGYYLNAGNTSYSINISTDSSSNYSYKTNFRVVDVQAYDAITFEPVFVDWSQDKIYSGGSSITLTVSIASAYDHRIIFFPILTYAAQH